MIFSDNITFETTRDILSKTFTAFEFEIDDMWDWNEVALVLAGKLTDTGYAIFKVTPTTNVLGDDVTPLPAQDWRDASDITTEGVESETL